MTHFSDCLVISSDRTPAGLLEMLQGNVMIAENLLVVDVMVRGGLTVGDIHHDTHMMFGPGMLEAYDMERCRARHPAILVNEAVGSDAAAIGLQHFLVRDRGDPDRNYVHYLLAFSAYDPTPRAGLLVLDGPARLVRHFIASRLARDTGSVRDKAAWLERYWNDTVGAAGVLGNVDREADLERPDAHPFRSVRALVARPGS